MDGNTVVFGGFHGVYSFDLASDASPIITVADNTVEYPNRGVGNTVKIHGKVVALRVQQDPSTNWGNPPPKETVAFYKKMEDGQWHRIVQYEAPYVSLIDGMVMAGGGFGLSVDFNDTDIFIGAPFGYPDGWSYPLRGSLFYYSSTNTLEH
jgi:hypothetical protein